MPDSELQRIMSFQSAFARRQAARVVDVPGGFAVYDDAFAHSRGNNQVFIDLTAGEGTAGGGAAGVGTVDFDAVPGIAEEALGHLPHRLVTVFDDEAGRACADPLIRAGYSHSSFLVMLHAGPVPVPDQGAAQEVDLDVLRVPLARRWRSLLPDVGEEVIHHLVERREARHRGADVVQFLGARTEDGEIASWADLYLDPATGTAQIEDLITSEAHLRRGHADAVLSTALRRAVDKGCTTRFLTADADDWPRRWYERRGFTAIGRSHCFQRG
ncbi:GNAT family N-acetyltransferase [Streptomyces sp. p1417]|uniref:GNAT family N-acetyltransferase n=1 Tax=Streptomyces typhae TaxID=2681492 RepID=A0A6L6WTD7_9ACTN|nr:GNAT family N-acetyltransferase [Streptomyces typhae]MVO85430.1 GNAT family N-acetyltransferase [Streptomyces typhae]